MQKKLPFEWIRTIKKHLLRLGAANQFGDFLRLNLGHPEPLEGYAEPTYSLHITPNVRLIFRLLLEEDSIEKCKKVELKGVCDYHGGKENWYVP